MGMLDDVKAKKKQKAADNWMKMADTAKTIEKQIEYYTKSLDINPYNAEAWFKKGKALENLGRFEEAKRCFDLAIEIDPDYQGLIGKKYESKASHEVRSEPPVVDESSLEPSSPVMEKEPVAWDQWVTETPISEEDNIISQEESSSYSAPTSGNSALSSALLNDADNGSPELVRKEAEDAGISVFSAVSNGVEKEHEEEPEDDGVSVFSAVSSGVEKGNEEEPEYNGISVFSAVSNGVEKEHEEEPEDDGISVFSAVSGEIEIENVEEEKEDTLTPVPVTSQEEPSDFSSDTNVISASRGTIKEEIVNEVHHDIPVVADTKKPASEQVSSVPEYKLPSDTISKSVAVASSGVEPVNIRIPLGEAIKFWAIGIVAMLVVVVLSSLIMGQ